MDRNDFNFYSDFTRLGLNISLLDLLPVKPNHIIPRNKDSYILESAEPVKSLALWIHKGQEASLAIQSQILQVCRQQCFKGFLYPLTLTDGRTYGELDEERWFYITPWPELRNVSFSDGNDVRRLVSLLAEFRRAIHEAGLLFCLPERRVHSNLLHKFEGCINQLNSYGMLARYRLKATEFDCLFDTYLPEILNQAAHALQQLEKTEYLNLTTELTTQDIIINKLTRQNIRISPQGEAVFLQLSDYQWDLPIIDLAILLTKTGRSSKWEMNWFHNIINEYKKYYKITSAEFQVIFAFLAFPWSLYRLASRYYYNRADWPLRKFIAKMERLIADDKNRIQFVNSLKNIGR